MSLGRKKDVKKVKIDAPPPITQMETRLPTGDRFLARQEGYRNVVESKLSGSTQRTVNQSQEALEHLARQLNTPDARRVDDIRQRSMDFYDLQAGAIHAEADAAYAQTASDLAKRFGGAYNATFGTDLLARLEANRLDRLYTAGKEAALFGEDLIRQDEDSRLRRFQMFQGYLADLNNQAQGFAGNSTAFLQNERERSQQLAALRAQLAMDRERYNQQAALTRREQRFGLVTSLVDAGSTLGAAFLRRGGGQLPPVRFSA